MGLLVLPEDVHLPLSGVASVSSHLELLPEGFDLGLKLGDLTSSLILLHRTLGASQLLLVLPLGLQFDLKKFYSLKFKYFYHEIILQTILRCSTSPFTNVLLNQNF